MAIRIQASALGIPVDAVATSVELDRSRTDVAVFNYRVEIAGDLSPEDRRVLDEAADNCPVRNTLGRRLIFLKSV